MIPAPSRRAIVAGIALAAAATLTCGCAPSSTGKLGELQQLATECPPTSLTSDIRIDESDSGRSNVIEATRLHTVESIALRTAVCGGQLTVTVFSIGSGAGVVVFDGDLHVPGATENARLRKVPSLVESTMQRIRESWASAIASLPQGGSDIVGMYRTIGEHASLFPNSRLEAYLFTDGLNNVSLTIDHALSDSDADALASQVPVPDLPANSTITVIGLGRVAGQPVPSLVIDGMVRFYDSVCARTGAAHCLAVTDWK